MKIWVVNLTKKRTIRAFAGISLALIVLISIVIGFIGKSYEDIIISSKADALPYEKIIILDAGHGGEDPGAVGANGLYEKDLNLQFAFEIGKALEEKGYIVVYTRTEDRLLYKEEENIKGIRKISDLKNRCQIAERYPDSIFVSIHMNSFGSSKYSGLQVYYSQKNNNSQALADLIQNKVISDLQPNNNRVIKPGNDMYILENINNTAVLIECGFLTNQDECKKLSEKEYQKELSFSIVCGIIEYIEKTN